ERRLQRKSDLGRLKKLREELAALAPDGIGVLQGQLDEVGRQKRLVLERRPTLADQPFDAAEADRRERSLQERTSHWKKALKDAENDAGAAQKKFEEANGAAAQAHTDQAAAKATETAARQEIQRLGEEADLSGKRQAADDVLAKAREILAAAALT